MKRGRNKNRNQAKLEQKIALVTVTLKLISELIHLINRLIE